MESGGTVAHAFPVELEHVIFEMAAFSWPGLMPRLLLVASRVKIWLEPLLYRTIVVNRSIFVQRERDDSRPSTIHVHALLSLVQSRPATFFRDSTRHLCVNRDLAEEGPAILSACSEIESLWMRGQTSAPRILELDLRLKRLHCPLNRIISN
ncbi:hypothetical protein C8R45DRAFT_1215448 [Mycena sanguinolenta]|nr:hypothetical protein C8R45DRAFT_1215448 [Mycena sanguinolenta]